MQTYFAKSVFNSKTHWFNALTLILSLLEATEVINVLPPGVLRYVPAVVAIINMILRQFTTRPVALVPPGEVKAVKVESLPATPPERK